MASDVRVCFLGDSLVAGTGDPECLGWTGRLAALSHADGLPLTPYNLGVRRDTSTDVLARWQTECVSRLPVPCDARIVVSFGINDTTEEQGRPRIDPETSVHNLRQLLTEAAAKGWRRFVVGPPPIAEDDHNFAIGALDQAFARVCREERAPYTSVFPQLRQNPVWMREVRDGDGAHPGAAGYLALTGLLAPAWRRWLNSPGTAAQRQTLHPDVTGSA